MNSTFIKAEEPNPFEQSFSTVSSKFNQYNPPKLTTENTNGSGVDVWVSDTSSYSYDSNSVNDTYSVSDHQLTSEDSSSSDDLFTTTMNPLNTSFAQQRPKRHSSSTTTTSSTSYNPQQQYQYQAQFINSNGNGKITRQSNKNNTTKKRTRTVKLPEDEEKRKNFLERNRLAALKCRQRKKQWLVNLQARVEYLANDNDQLQMESEALRKEIMDLKTLLVAHKDCPNYNHNALVANQQQQQQQQQHSVYHQDFIMN